MRCGAFPLPENSREVHEPTTSSRPLSIGKLAPGAVFETGACAFFELPLAVAAIRACLHTTVKKNGIVYLLASGRAWHATVVRFARWAIAAAGQPLVDPAHVDAASAADRN
jgi:hypothetical protein